MLHLFQAVEQDPKNLLARFKRAAVMVTVGMDSGALTELMTLAEEASKEAAVHHLLGRVYKRLGCVDEAIMAFQLALDLDPKNGSVIKQALDNIHRPDPEGDEIDLTAL